MPHDPVVFFLDRTLGRNVVAAALRAAGADVRVHVDCFEPTCPDPQWLLDVGRRGWVVITQDKGIRRRPLEVAAIRNANVRAFVVTSARATGPVLGALLVRHLPRMREIIEYHGPPFTALVSGEGVKLRDV